MSYTLTYDVILHNILPSYFFNSIVILESMDLNRRYFKYTERCKLIKLQDANQCYYGKKREQKQ